MCVWCLSALSRTRDEVVTKGGSDVFEMDRTWWGGVDWECIDTLRLIWSLMPCNLWLAR